MSRQINIHEAETQLSQLLAKLNDGEEIVIARAGRPIAKLVPVIQQPTQRHPGSAKGKVTIAPDFDAPLPECVLKTFEE